MVSITEHVAVPGAIVLSTTALVVGIYVWNKRSDTSRSTTSSVGGGALVYETSRAVDEYVQMHFALPDEVLPYKKAPKNDVNFPERCAYLVERYCDALKDFTGERAPPIALDIGCAVGGATFHLSKCGFANVLGIDYSRGFIKAANVLKTDGMIPYKTTTEGKLTETREAHIPTDAEPERVRFMVGDACNLPSNLAPVDAVLAANLVCRLPHPTKFLDQLQRIVKPGGIVVLTTPFSWLESWTKQRHWLGGFIKDGSSVSSFVELGKVMNRNGFRLQATEDMPFVIREHARKFQWGCAQGSVWLKVG